MRQLFIMAILLMASLFASAQEGTTDAAYPEGNDALSTMIMKNLRYPKECLERDIQGKVTVRFEVKKDGSIGKVSIVDSPHKSMSDEVLRIVSLFPKWIPAKKDGKAIGSEVTLPVAFRLASDNEQKAMDVTCADKPETIETFVANQYETEWYGAQAQAWQKVVDANPKDQWAWRNLFRATYYYDTFAGGFRDGQDSSRTADVLRKMEAELPGSFVLNLCKCRFCLTTDPDAHSGKYVRRAIELMPEDVCDEDVNYLTARLWYIAPEDPQVAELNKQTHRRKYYPEHLLRYNWNMLRSMEPDALYFSNGDALTQPMKMLQDALDERTDVCVIPVSFLYDENYRNVVCKRLGIQPVKISWDDYDYAEYGDDRTKMYVTDIIMHLMHESGRPAYFSTDMLSFTTLNKDSLYNEGLVLKYSDHPYNNFAVAMHNVKEVYHLEYLTEPEITYNGWNVIRRLDTNNVMLLGHLVPKLRKSGDEAEANRLYNTLKTYVERCDEDPEYKEYLMSKLKEE